MMLRTCKIGSAKNLISTRISKGSEDPVQVFNKYGSLDGLDEMDIEVVQSSTPFKRKKDYKPILPP